MDHTCVPLERGNQLMMNYFQQSNSLSCCCNRPRGKILCKACGHILDGRVRRPCPLHPKVIFLMDKEQCPRCKAYSHLMQEFQCSG